MASKKKQPARRVQKSSVEVVLGDVVEEMKSLREELNVLKQTKNYDDEFNALREEVLKLKNSTDTEVPSSSVPATGNESVIFS